MIDKQHWPRVTFGDVVRQVKDKIDPLESGITRYIAGEHMDTDDLRIRRWGDISGNYLGPAFHMRFKPGHVLYGSRRTYLRKVAVADFEGICANTTFVLETKDPTVLLPELLPFVMQTEAFHDHSIKQSKGSVNPYVNFSDLAWYEFALPPLEEQRRIAEVLWALEGVHVTAKEAGRSAAQLLASRVEHFLRNYNTKTYALPVEELLTEAPRNGFSPPANSSGQGQRTVSISSIANGFFVPDGNIKFAEVETQRVEQFLVKADDVFVVRGNGNRYLTGKCGISRKSYKDLFYPDLLIRLRFDVSRIIPGYAVLEWNAPSIHRRLISRAKSTNGIWKINGQDIRDHVLVVPPVDDQTHLLAEVDEMTKATTMLEGRAKDAAGMKALMLNHLVLGRP